MSVSIPILLSMPSPKIGQTLGHPLLIKSFDDGFLFD